MWHIQVHRLEREVKQILEGNRKPLLKSCPENRMSGHQELDLDLNAKHVQIWRRNYWEDYEVGGGVGFKWLC